jgi:hypothetical protein
MIFKVCFVVNEWEVFALCSRNSYMSCGKDVLGVLILRAQEADFSIVQYGSVASRSICHDPFVH